MTPRFTLAHAGLLSLCALGCTKPHTTSTVATGTGTVSTGGASSGGASSGTTPAPGAQPVTWALTTPALPMSGEGFTLQVPNDWTKLENTGFLLLQARWNSLNDDTSLSVSVARRPSSTGLEADVQQISTEMTADGMTVTPSHPSDFAGLTAREFTTNMEERPPTLKLRLRVAVTPRRGVAAGCILLSEQTTGNTPCNELLGTARVGAAAATAASSTVLTVPDASLTVPEGFVIEHPEPDSVRALSRDAENPIAVMLVSEPFSGSLNNYVQSGMRSFRQEGTQLTIGPRQPVRIGNVDGTQFDATMQVPPVKIEQRLRLVHAGSFTYVVLCGGTPTLMKDHGEVCDNILDSFRPVTN